MKPLDLFPEKHPLLNEASLLQQISGLTYLPEYISIEQEKELLHSIDSSPWITDIARRVQHYGYRYDYKASSLNQSQKLGPLPKWAINIATQLQADHLIEKIPEQVIVNEYLPGQGIAKHVDHIKFFGEPVISLSLGSPCVMDFIAKENSAKQISVYLAPRSVVLLAGAARYQWYHRISKRKRDTFNEIIFPRSRRVSLTFRYVLP